jgi:hypothetical protein
MKNKSVLKILFFTAILYFSILSCSPKGTSKVTIIIDLGLQNKAAFNMHENSIIDRIFRLFAKDAEAQSAPSNISSLTLNITGDGMTRITQSYTTPIPDTITINEVPSGSSRTFEVLAYTPSATLKGAAIRDLASGATVTIPISMGLYETKIVIPDWYNSRMVQIDDMNGTNWTPRTSISGITQFRPYDIDFDSSGKIYIANNRGGSAMGDNCVISLDDFNSNNIYLYPSASVRGSAPFYDYGVVAIAVDRINNYVYYALSPFGTPYLFRAVLGDNTTHMGLTISGITAIRGLAVDNTGILYIAGESGSSVPTVFQYNPTDQLVTGTYLTNLLMPWDILIKNDYLYISDYDKINPYDSSKIVQLSLNLIFINQFGTAGSSTFYGPHRFLAILNNRFYLIDENEDTTSETERIIAFDTFNSTINTFDPSMVGQSPFSFYSNS